MPIRAITDGKFQARLGLIAAACLGISLWFLYDGAIAWPQQRERALAYQRLEEEGRLEEEWVDLTEERGWSVKNPGPPKSEGEIYFQLLVAALAAVPALLYTFFFVQAWGRWIEADRTGLRTSWGQRVEFEQITQLDKKQWKKKGIAKIHYHDDGRARRLVLDDWKYQAEPTVAILREVEYRIRPDQIVGGEPEPPIEDAQSEAAVQPKPEDDVPAQEKGSGT